MARCRTSMFEDIVDIVSSFPWWVGCSLAALSYAILHFIAGIEVTKPVGVGEFGSYAGKQLYVKLAYFGQLVLPVAFGLGAFISLIKSFRQRKTYDCVRQGKPEALSSLTWREFEILVGEFFRGQGYEIKQTGGNGPDGGIDLVLTKEGEKFLVQCKQWKAYKVGVQVVRELYGVMASAGAVGGFVITSGVFSKDARQFAVGLNIQLINGAGLHQMIAGVRQRPPAESVMPPKPGEIDVPGCPKCGAKMVKRTARRGSNAGGNFWGCVGYPRCRGIRSI